MALTFSSVREARTWHRSSTFAMDPPKLSRISSPAGATVGSYTGRLKAEEWQKQAYDHVEQIGELGYVLEVMASTLAEGQLVVVEYDEQGRVIEPEKDQDGEVIASPLREKAERVLHAFRGPEGDHHAMLSNGCWHDQIAGEAILLGSEIPDNGGVSWELLSVLEIVQSNEARSDGTRKTIRKRSATHRTSLSVADPTSSEQELGDDTYMTRYLRRSKAHSGDATSVLKRNAAVCREIVLLDQLKETMIESRLSAGIVFVPDEATFPADDEGVSDVTEADRFLEVLMDHITAPVKDRGNPASLGPLIVRVPADLIEKFKLFSLTDGHLDLAAVEEARTNALTRLAAGLDLPPERMQGLGGTSHWNAAGIEADEIRKHIIPLGSKLARFFTEFYMRRMLVEFEDADEDEAGRVALAYDPSKLLTRTDTTSSADTLWEDGLITDDERVKSHGFDPDKVRPSPAERARRIVERLAVVPHANNRILLDAVIDWDELEMEQWIRDEFLSIPATTEIMDEDEAEGGGGQPVLPAGPAEPAVGEPGVDRETLAVIERIRTLSSMAVNRTLEKAASQVVSMARRLPPDKQALIERTPRHGARKCEVLHVMTDSDWRAINRQPKKMLDGAYSDVERMTSLWLTDLFCTWGHPQREAQLRARRAAAFLVDGLHELTMQGFNSPLDHDPAAEGLVVPLRMVVDTVGAASIR